jgi:uncharacterized protein YcsI (UPF0317 family)
MKPGEKLTSYLAKGADITTDLPRYNVYRDGNLYEVLTDVSHLWQEVCS